RRVAFLATPDAGTEAGATGSRRGRVLDARPIFVVVLARDSGARFAQPSIRDRVLERDARVICRPRAMIRRGLRESAAASAAGVSQARTAARDHRLQSLDLEVMREPDWFAVDCQVIAAARGALLHEAASLRSGCDCL